MRKVCRDLAPADSSATTIGRRGWAEDDVRERVQACECDIIIDDQVGWNRLEIAAKATLVLKPRAKFRGDEIIRHLAKDAAGDVDAAFRARRQRKISSDVPEHGAK